MALAGMVLSACAADGTTVYPTAAFAHRVATQDVEICWNCTKLEPGLLRLDGVARNIGGQEVRFLELELDSVDGKDSSPARAAAALPDSVLHINQVSPFHLQLPTRGNEARFDLYYRYYLPPPASVH